MKQMQIQLFLVNNQKNFFPTHIPVITEKLQKMNDEEFIVIASASFKNPTTMLLISLFFGCFGIDRFIIGDIGMGILKLLTFGGLGIITIIDWFIIMNKTRANNFNDFMQIINIAQKSVSNTTQKTNGIEKIKQYKEMLDEGIITQEEFDNFKKQML